MPQHGSRCRIDSHHVGHIYIFCRGKMPQQQLITLNTPAIALSAQNLLDSSGGSSLRGTACNTAFRPAPGNAAPKVSPPTFGTDARSFFFPLPNQYPILSEKIISCGKSAPEQATMRPPQPISRHAERFFYVAPQKNTCINSRGMILRSCLPLFSGISQHPDGADGKRFMRPPCTRRNAAYTEYR